MKDKYKNLIQNAIDIIFETDANGNFTFVNNFTMQLLGYTLEEILDKPFTNFVREDYKDQVLYFYADLLYREKDFPLIQFPINKKDGTVVWVSLKVIATRDETGSIKSYSGIVRDISDLKSAEFNEQKRLDKIQNYNKTINFLSSFNFSYFNNFNEVLELILKETALTTQTDIISYWKYDNNKLTSQTNYNSSTDRINHKTLNSNEFLQINFDLLKEKKLIIISDLKTRPNQFLKNLDQINEDINSMLIMSVFLLCKVNKT